MKLSDSEWTVMKVVWDGSCASARDVFERVAAETNWAYTTVKTTLDRLVEKGALRVRKQANRSLYEPLVSRTQARRSALHYMLDKAFDGAFGSLLQHMVATEKLTKRDRESLAALLAEMEQKPKEDA
jgi:predicted transcriptional regulator